MQDLEAQQSLVLEDSEVDAELDDGDEAGMESLWVKVLDYDLENNDPTLRDRLQKKEPQKSPKSRTSKPIQ